MRLLLCALAAAVMGSARDPGPLLQLFFNRVPGDSLRVKLSLGWALPEWCSAPKWALAGLVLFFII